MAKYQMQKSSFEDLRLLANELYRKGDSYSDVDLVLKRLWSMQKEGKLELLQTKEAERQKENES